MDLVSPPTLRIFTAGNVDDGKSTLMGRLLYDSKVLAEDHIQVLEKSLSKQGKLDYSLLTDGLLEEREKKITIDVCYRYFSKNLRNFVLIDAPGHEEYTRNMATGASQADVLLLLFSVEKPLSSQTKRHMTIAFLFGIQQFVIVVNKLDLVGYCQKAFENAKKEFEDFYACLSRRFFKVKEVAPHLHFVPVSALDGENVVDRSRQMPWYQGRALFEVLEQLSFPVSQKSSWRLPIQCVLQSQSESPFYAGTLLQGDLRKGDEAICFPSLQKMQIQTILHQGKEVEEARQGQSIALQLYRIHTKVDLERGALLASSQSPPRVLRQVSVSLLWLSGEKGIENSSYFLMHGAQKILSYIEKIEAVLDIHTLEYRSQNTLKMNEIGNVLLRLEGEIYADFYREDRHLGSLILIDCDTHQTVAAGLIEKRAQDLANTGFVIWFTGLPASGKTTLSNALERVLKEKGRWTVFLMEMF